MSTGEIVKRLAGLAGYLGTHLMDILVPCRCLHCFETEPGSMHLGLCTSCLARLEPINSQHRRACDLCGATLHTPDASTPRCIPCRTKAPQLDRLFCAWRYIEPLDAVIQGLKFDDLSYLGRHLALELDRVLPPDLSIDAVVPLPLHWFRSWRRGYNQAAEIARPLARRRGWRLENALVRKRATRAQSGLDRAERKRNLRGAFRVKGASGARAANRRWRRRRRRHRGCPRDGFDARGKSLLLVDDVYTTGATLEAAAQALKAAGAGWVGAAVAGRTPLPKH